MSSVIERGLKEKNQCFKVPCLCENSKAIGLILDALRKEILSVKRPVSIKKKLDILLFVRRTWNFFYFSK